MQIPIRHEDRQPSDAGGGAEHLAATIDYIPKNSKSLAVPGVSHAESGRYDCLDPPRAPGELGWLAHYRVRRLLGEGGMGLVFEAEDTDLLRPVALKIIRPELAGSPQASQRFTLEARAMAALKHDHIVTIYQVGQQRGVPFLVMEYLRGMSLSGWLDRGHKPSVDLVLRIGREIGTGLAAAHHRCLIHRDIKPANIWLEAPHGRVKILDFGLARSESRDMQITNPGMAVGSPAYTSPEQARGDGGNPSCDLFSLGCVLYELCTRQLPFSGKTVMAVLTSLMTDTPRSPRDLNPAVPPALEAVIMRLLAKEPADRPSSSQVVVDVLKAIERDLMAERQRAELSPAAPLLAVVSPPTQVAAGIVGEPDAPRPAATSRSVRCALWIGATVGVLGIAAVAMVVGFRDAVAPKRTLEVVATIGPSRAVPEPGPPPSPLALFVPPNSTEAPAETRERVADPPSGAKIDEALRKATPDHGRPPQGIQEKPVTHEPAKEVRKPDVWGDVFDPDGDCRIAVDMEKSRATFLVPGTPHLLSAEIGRMNAPRILREIRGEFDVRVRVTGTTHPGGRATTTQYNPYHGAGILIWQDPENYVRLEIAADLRDDQSAGRVHKGGVFPYANFELRQAGRLAVTWGFKIEDGSSYLRLERRGAEFHGAVSSDGDYWTRFPTVTADLKDRVEVGVVVVNSASKPLKAGFEELRVTGSPGTETEVNADSPQPPKRSLSQKTAPGPRVTSS